LCRFLSFISFIHSLIMFLFLSLLSSISSSLYFFPVLVWPLAQFPRLSQLFKFLFPHLMLFIHAIYSWLIWINIEMQTWARRPSFWETAMSVNCESCPHNNK
jgi:hypothetical protein